MTGHGRPSSFAIACARRARAATRLLGIARQALTAGRALILCALFAVTVAAQDTPTGEPVRLRIKWGGNEATRWSGRVWLDDGSLSNLKLLGLAADSAGSIWLEHGQVHVASLSARKLDEIEIAAAANPNSRLMIVLSSDARQAPSPIAISFSELLARPYALRIDDRGNTLQVEIVPDNPLRIVTDREPLIFSPGEQFSFELRPLLPDMAPGTTLDIHTTLSPARRHETLWSDDPRRLAVPLDGPPAVTLSVPMPKAEGVYNVRVTATRPPGFRPRFFPGGNAPLAEHKFDVVVLNAEPHTTSAAATWDSVLEIDPTNPSWWERLPNWTQLRRIPGLKREPLGSIRAGAVDLPLGRFVELSPSVAGADPHWQAYSLPLEAVDTPHLLEIEYPADEEQHFGISIVEPNAAGQVEGIGRDGGVYVEGFGRSEAKQIQTHRTVFWPRTQAPLLLMTNQHPTSAAHFGHIRVLKRSTGQLTSSAARSPSERLVAAYVARPLLAETFGASEGLETSFETSAFAAQAVDDWQTFYESATRLAEYLRYGGYNSAVVNVLANGSTIYPSAQLLPTPLHNMGRAGSEAKDRDGLELLLRVFDRDGLALLPALQFAAPLPELEALRRGSNPQTSGLEWVGPNGKTWLETYGSKDGLAPYYNLLEPRVQEAILHVVDELIDRYGDHPALAGLAIQLSASGYAQLPPLDWGLDDATIGRFQRDSGIQLVIEGSNRFAARHALLTGAHAQAWRAWRTARVAEFYGRIAALVRANHSDRRLILTLEESFAHPQLAARVRPNILLTNRVDNALLDSGIDRGQIENLPGIVVCATRYVEPTTPLPQRAVDFELNEAFAAWQRHANSPGETAALLYHRPQRRHLASFKAKNPPFKIAGEMGLVSQSLAHSHAVRKPYVRTLLQHDPSVLVDGGELLPLGQEDVLREVRSIVRQLPTAADVTEVAKQPVIVRTYTEPNRVTLLVMNACPWNADAEVILEVPQAATMELLVDGSENISTLLPLALAPGRQPWSLSLEPYAVQAVRIATPGVRVIEVHAAASDAAKAELATRLADLANRDLTAPRLYPMLSNPSFEPVGGAGPPLGWRLSGNSATAELDATNPQEGKTCLYFRSEGGLAVLESDPFPTPPTGQLAMTVFMRDQKVAPDSELRMVFESVHAGQVYRRFTVVAAANRPAKQVAGQWQSQPLLVNDLPLESPGEMRVRFELSGPGEVWLDSVMLYELLFPLKFYKYEEAEILQFVQLTHAAKNAFDEGRVADCVRLLERYWPRFLAEYAPLIQPAIAVERTQKADPRLPPPANQKQEPTPGIGERIKRAFPFMR